MEGSKGALGVLVLRCFIQLNAKVSKPRDGPPLDRPHHRSAKRCIVKLVLLSCIVLF